MPRIEPTAPSPEGNAVTNSLLARVMGRCPDILRAFGRLDNAIRFHGRLPGELKEAIRRATAGEVGCEYCRSLGAPRTDLDQREALAVAFAQAIAQDPSGISDAQFDVLREEFDEEEIVELVAFTCLVAISGQMFGAVMGLEPASEQEGFAYQDVLAAKD
ncbi:MAG: carboxymuconolactone decarboxylase family protein [Solirubrobacteraceae bacterium]